MYQAFLLSTLFLSSHPYLHSFFVLFSLKALLTVLSAYCSVIQMSTEVILLSEIWIKLGCDIIWGNVENLILFPNIYLNS